MFNLIMDPVPAPQQSRDNGGLTQDAQLTDNTGRARPEREREGMFLMGTVKGSALVCLTMHKR